MRLQKPNSHEFGYQRINPESIRPLRPGDSSAEACETTSPFAAIVKRVRDLAQASYTWLSTGKGLACGRLTPAQQALHALLQSLEPDELYALLTLAHLGRGAWRNPPDLGDLYQRQRHAFTPAAARAFLLNCEDLGKHLDMALDELRERGLTFQRH